jgi:hypothetical protein
MASSHSVDAQQRVPAPDVVSTGPCAPVAPLQLTPEFLDHEGLARQLSCSVTTVHKLRRDRVLGEPCHIGSLVRWHWPSVRERILAQAAAPQISTGDPFLEGLDGPQ